MFVRLRIINSSFSNTTSRHIGGALYVITEKLFAIVRDSLFVRCSATSFPGTVYVSTYDDTTIRLHNNYFLENTGCNEGIVHATSLGKESFLNISIANVMFARNTLCKPVPAKNTTDGVVTFFAASTKIVVDFENTHFIGNVGRHGCCILIYFLHASMLHSINLYTCTFGKNIGYFGTVFVKGQTSLTLKNSIFDSNGIVPPSRSMAMLTLFLNDSKIFIMNTTIVNNFCKIFFANLGGKNSSLRIYDSKFVGNKNIYHAGGALLINSIRNKARNYNILINRVLFKENIARAGSVLSVANGDVVFRKCTFLNNFALLQGSQIINAGVGIANLALVDSVFRQTIEID